MDDAEKESADQLPSQRDPYAALRYPSYRRYIGGVFLGRLGRSMVDLAVSWQVYEWTGSAAALGLVGVFHILPLLLFGLPAGNWADRHDRKQITLYTSIGTATLSATLGILALWRDRIPNVLPLSLLGYTINGIIAFLERAPASLPATGTNGALPLLYLIILVLAAVKIVGGPSRAAMLPNLVPPTALPNALAWNRTIFQIAKLAGPVLSGSLIAVVGYTTVYFIGAVFIFAMVCIIRHMTYRGQKLVRPTESSIADLTAGVRFVHRHKSILAIIILDVMAVLLGGTTALLPVFADRILHIGPAGLGWLIAAEGAGAFAAALFLAYAPPLSRPGATALVSVAGFGFATLLFGLSQWLLLSLVALFLVGAMNNISGVVRQSVIHLSTPDELRGRVTAIGSIFIGSSKELGAIRSGFMAALLGPVASVVIGAAGTIFVVALVDLVWPGTRKIPHFHQLLPKSR